MNANHPKCYKTRKLKRFYPTTNVSFCYLVVLKYQTYKSHTRMYFRKSKNDHQPIDFSFNEIAVYNLIQTQCCRFKQEKMKTFILRPGCVYISL